MTPSLSIDQARAVVLTAARAWRRSQPRRHHRQLEADLIRALDAYDAALLGATADEVEQQHEHLWTLEKGTSGPPGTETYHMTCSCGWRAPHRFWSYDKAIAAWRDHAEQQEQA